MGGGGGGAAHALLLTRGQQSVEERKPDGVKQFPPGGLVGFVGLDELCNLQP